MSKRGILYMVWGERAKEQLARSRRSLEAVHPDLPVHVEYLPDDSTWLEKAKMLDVSPYETTLFLDSDTTVLGRLDYGFEKAEKFSLACCINECPWARRNAGLAERGDIIEYNSGVVFFTRQAKPVFDGWKDRVRTLDSSVKHVQNGELKVMKSSDQASFSQTLDELGVSPFVLPLNWNFRPIWHRSFFGPIKIWHDRRDAPANFEKLAQYYARPDAVIQYVELAPNKGA
ncbi:MAG TPA: hypothetical protein VFS04_03710 [Alphaproteobacteria bacterium]|nr:hypothetical protein [Alphaproteobacteria bacterium]